MQTYALLALLPSLAFALPAASDATVTAGPSATESLPYCVTATGAAGISCILTAEGFAPAAAGYFASVDSDPAVSSYLEEVFTNSAFEVPLSQAIQSIIGTSTDNPPAPTAYEGVMVSIFNQHLTEVPSGTARDVASSVLAQVQALQTGGPGAVASAPSKAAAPRQTGLGVAAGLAAGVLGLAMGL